MIPLPGVGSPRREPPASVSVVMPVLNEVNDLPDQLDALARQTYGGRWELIVCDNGSGDGTAELVASWQSRLPHLKLVDASGRRGINHARNVGVSHATGEFIAFCDGDDIVAPTWLEALADAATDGDVVGGALDMALLNGGRQPAGGQPDMNGLPVKHDFLLGVPGGNCGVWAKVARALGWDERFTFGGSDIEFSWRAQLAGCRIAFAPEAVVHVRRPDGVATQVRQWYRYGTSGGLLYKLFREQGMPRSRLWAAVRAWARLLFHVGDLFRSAQGRREWLTFASYRVGRLVGAARAGVVFP